MKFERIELSGGAYMDAYIADPVGDFTRRALLVIPGGGYSNVCSEREGEPIAFAFLSKGYNAFVLHYTVSRKRPFPTQLLEAAEAITTIRERADEWGHGDEVFAVGFSAGGHLAACAGILWKHPAVAAAGFAPRAVRPTGVMLCYPVTTPASHLYSHKSLWCTDTPTDEQLAQSDVTRHVDGESSPAFLMHTFSDQLVDVRGTLALASAYRDAGVPFEMHISPDGVHGAALANRITQCGFFKPDPAVAQWVEQAALWADRVCGELKQ